METEFKQRFYNHTKSFKHQQDENCLKSIRQKTQ